MKDRHTAAMKTSAATNTPREVPFKGTSFEGNRRTTIPPERTSSCRINCASGAAPPSPNGARKTRHARMMKGRRFPSISIGALLARQRRGNHFTQLGFLAPVELTSGIELARLRQLHPGFTQISCRETVQ